MGPQCPHNHEITIEKGVYPKGYKDRTAVSSHDTSITVPLRSWGFKFAENKVVGITAGPRVAIAIGSESGKRYKPENDDRTSVSTSKSRISRCITGHGVSTMKIAINAIITRESVDAD